MLQRGRRARGNRSRRGRGRDRRLRAADRRAVVEHRAQRLAAGRPADRDRRGDDRPPVRIGPAGRQLRRRADRRRRPRRRHRRRRRAHGPDPAGDRLYVDRAGRNAVSAGADREAQPHRAGAQRRDDRRALGDPALRARRARRPLAPPRPPGDRGGPLRARDRPVRHQRRDALRRPGHPARHEPRDARGAEARLQARRQGHGRDLLADLRRRGGDPADVARQGRAARRHPARADRRSDDRRRRPRDDAHRSDPGDAQAAGRATG